MRSPRIYVALALSKDAKVELPSEAVHHLVKVLRIKQEQTLRLFNGDGREYHASILSMSKSKLQVKIVHVIDPANESKLNLTLLQGLSKGEKMEFTIQKSVELGVQTIVPIITERSVVRLNAERIEKKGQHWNNVANSASEQCGRCVLTTIAKTCSLEAALQYPEEFVGFTLDPTATQKLSDLPQPDKPIRLLIGPEGGLSKAEIETAKLKGYQAVSLGPRILRTETAGLTAIAVVQTLWGDL